MDIYLIGVLVLGVAAFVFMHLKKKGKKGLGPLAPKKDGWLIEYSSGTPERPTLHGSGWFVEIPLSPGYLGTVKGFDLPKQLGLRVGGTLTVKGYVVGTGARSVETPTGPAHASVIIQRNGDQLLDPVYRWYSEQVIPLVQGDFSLEIPVTTAGMFDMMGGRDPNALAKTVIDASNVGIGFGGDGGRAHGVYADSPTRFVLTELSFR